MAGSVVLAALGHVWTTLEPTGFPRALMGGLALASWKHVRSTHDVAFLIDPGPAGVEALLEMLRQAGSAQSVSRP
jgi:glyoxylase-like metal-dependent hydrolase (beta-lactamase superfamily II)